MCAARAARTECVRLLLESGVGTEAKDEVRNRVWLCQLRPFRESMLKLHRDFFGKIACFVLLLLHLSRVVPCFAPQNLNMTQSGVTALGHALASGHADCVRVLIDCGADASADGIDQAQLERLLAHANVTAEDALWM